MRRIKGSATISCLVLALAPLSVTPLLPGTGGGVAEDEVCEPDFILPHDCVDQLGAIGEPPVSSSSEGYLNIVSPIVDPLLLLSSSTAADGRLFVLNPLGNTVRVLDPTNALALVADIQVCYRPSALAQNGDGSQVLVSCHASGAVGVIDTATNLMVAEIQERDPDGRPLLQEPMAIAVVGQTAYVASSQNHRLAVIDLETRRVQGTIELPGEDPRTLAATADGQFLVVANFLAGNRTETDLQLNDHIFDDSGGAGRVCAPLLVGDGAHLIDETHTDFMDTSHPDYDLLAECYLFAHTFGTSSQVVVNPARPDHDVVVVRLSDGQVVFTTDSLAQDIGTLNYGLRYETSNGRLYVVTTHARNDLGLAFDNRPLLNRLAVLELDPLTGALSLHAIRDLDDPFLDDAGLGSSVAATPYAVDVEGTRVLIAAAGSDRLVLADLDGNVTGHVAVGFTPKGVVAVGDTAYVYNATGLTVSEVDLVAGQQVATAGIGPNPMRQTERIGAHFMNSGQFAINKSFSCMSCHPDGHTDALVWVLNADDGLRSTMTMQEIAEFAPYHWDGEKCNLAKILKDGITFLFQDPDGPSPCEMRTMIDFLNGMVRPHTPHRAADDSMTELAKLGLGIIHRANFKDLTDETLACSGREPDPAMEHKYLAAVADPFAAVHVFDGGAGPIGGTSTTETCSRFGCHVAPHWAHQGGEFEAVSIHGMWDRPISMHHGRPTRTKFLEALEINRVHHGAPSMDPAGHVTGRVAAHAFHDGHFRHPELNFDANPLSHAFTLTDSMTQFAMEEEHFQTGTVGLTVVFDATNTSDPDKNARLDLLVSAAGQGKIALVGVGLIGGELQGLTWDAVNDRFASDAGGTYTIAQLAAALGAGDSVLLYGALRPDQQDVANPKLKAVVRTTSPILCAEGYNAYHATLQTGEVAVRLLLQGIDVVAGSRVMIDGQVTGAPLAGAGPNFTWVLPQVPAAPAILALQVLSPNGLQSNSLALPVVDPVVPALEPNVVSSSKPATQSLALFWQDQFGVTGPGTRYDVFRGQIGDLPLVGLTQGRCLDAGTADAESFDPDLPDPGTGFFYLLRAQNQLNVTSYGSPTRDAEAAASVLPCPALFP